ncbi:SDR family oxidoreductase [Paucilactobacillus wasatchensis]|uniref:Short-chain dehydrogenase/reductase SDR n=1 Tax=Paucilactobacillus wasatchensis TaxID=1335616 RepID=A0A0D0Y5Q7_9LACO|nr:SDR family oxidoreductase [Paucilactobacillus wasatchensis]KIS03608.1 Short-chain dehydrogenase/reductase SDR [Paucilactobacillus wasatchensis]
MTKRVVVVTGASSGIGAATTKLLVERGAKVVIGARREERLQELATELGNNVIYRKTDVTSVADVKALMNLALDKFGHIDALYNNAGIMPIANLSEDRHAEWKNMLNINVMGVLNGISAALPVMKQQGYGHILATDSLAGHLVMPEYAVYCGTKFAVRAIMEGLQQEEHNNGIRSTIISPGAVNTELYLSESNEAVGKALKESWQQPNTALSPEDVAEAVVYAIFAPTRVNVSEIYLRPAGQLL